jgi:hypothetical protein
MVFGPIQSLLVWIERTWKFFEFGQLLTELKGHSNEADFLGFLHKLVRHRSFTVHFEPFRFWLRILNRKTTRMPIDTSFFKPLNKSMVLVNYIPGLSFAKLVL